MSYLPLTLKEQLEALKGKRLVRKGEPFCISNYVEAGSRVLILSDQGVYDFTHEEAVKFLKGFSQQLEKKIEIDLPETESKHWGRNLDNPSRATLQRCKEIEQANKKIEKLTEQLSNAIVDKAMMERQFYELALHRYTEREIREAIERRK